jgi:hypothetical protein
VSVIALFFFLIFFSMRQPRKMTIMLPFILALVGGILAIASPMILLMAQPGAFAADSNCSSISAGCQGAESSFFGSNTTSTAPLSPLAPAGSVTLSWGPGVGWYLAIAAGAVMIVGACMIKRCATRQHQTDSALESLHPKPDWVEP